MYNIFSWKKRPFIYAIVLGIGFLFLVNILKESPPIFYLRGVIVLYLVFVFEVWGTIYYAKKLMHQYKLDTNFDNNSKFIRLINHLILPTLLYFGITIFIYLHNINSFIYIIIFFSVILFAILFTNIRAYYEDKFRLEMFTHNIYDLTSILVFFIWSYVSIGILFYFGYNIYFSQLIVLILMMLMNLLIIFRLNIISKQNIFISMLLAFAIISFNITLLWFNINYFTIAFFDTIIFYYTLAYFNHSKEDTLSSKVIREYILVFALLLVIIFGVF
jgi:hypothetical protein